MPETGLKSSKLAWKTSKRALGARNRIELEVSDQVTELESDSEGSKKSLLEIKTDLEGGEELASILAWATC